MRKYRFKTREEFELIGRWMDDDECPVGWAEEMNEYLGLEILSSDCIALCESNDDFNMDGWSFSNHDYVIIETTTIDRNLLIDCSSEAERDVVFNYLESQGEKTNRTMFGFSQTCNKGDWYFVGYYSISEVWTVAREGKFSFGDKVISAKEFLNGAKPKEESVKPKSLVGRWVKLLSNFSSDQKIGSYDLIIEDDEKRSCINLEKYRMCARERLTDGDLELMPEGWSPDSESIPEYVECINALMFAKRGKIYPVVSDTMCICEDGNTYYWKGDEFQPSTKEAYEAQEAKNVKFKIGDWVVITQDTNDKGKIGQILSKEPNSDPYWRISNMIHPYMDCQLRLALPHELFDKNIKGTEMKLDDDFKLYPIYATTGDSLLKPLIENVQSINVNLRTKKQINKFKF